tara:strand:- start:3 stop:854 length:852 start_codon:yes stop_codon:yes gene_type:complete
MNKSFKNLEVLEFYKELPFNIYDNENDAIVNIKKNDPTKIYPPLKEIFETNKNINILDVGCGAGWFVNSISYFQKNINVTGVDFNPVALTFAKKIKEKLKLNSNFIEKDLFTINFKKQFFLISSLGVLHHTNNCHEAIKVLLQQESKYVLIGLYHKYGRKAFLDHFQNLKENFLKTKKKNFEQELFEEYKKLDKRSQNETHLKSWFKDQVLHPYETQHTFEELISIFDENKYKIYSTSLNRFSNFKSYNEIINVEKDWYQYGKDQLIKNHYFPGFFIILAKKM